VRIGLVAGEASGDTLGGAFIEAVKARVPGAQFVGVGGPKMRAAGLEAWESSEALAVMGLVEVVKHLPRLLQLRKSLRQRFLAANLDVFVGIDAPEFNLGLARQLKRGGLKCVQYVSPQVWAWRQGRVRTMHESCDLVLCLLPFEPAFYAQHGVRAQFVGHPLADQIPLEIDRSAARAKLGLAPDIPVVALLPGSRRGEVDKLGADFANAARLLANGDPRIAFIAPMAGDAVARIFREQVASIAGGNLIRLLAGQAREALAACDVAIVASGTATLETALSKRPMVVAYRVGGTTAFLLRKLGLVKVQYFSQPNLLAGAKVVPELFQEAVTADALAREVRAWLDAPEKVTALAAQFAGIHRELRVGGAALAADCVLDLILPKRLLRVDASQA
jgi:lipid-A-disaccharide synthase